MKPSTREQKTRTLENDLWVLCGSRFKDPTLSATDAEHDFVNLVNELCETPPTIAKQAAPAKQFAEPVAVQS